MLGATLRQRQPSSFHSPSASSSPPSTERTIAYYSRKLSGPETRYSAYDRELLAIRDALRHWHHYLSIADVTVYCDQKTLQHVLKQSSLSPRQMRFLEPLMQYNFEIHHIAGAKNYVQDALSRRPDYREPPIVRNLQLHALTDDHLVEIHEEIASAYKDDPLLDKVMHLSQAPDLPAHYASATQTASPSELRLWRKAKYHATKHYDLRPGPPPLLQHRYTGTVIVPDKNTLTTFLIGEAHDANGHDEVTKTAERLRRKFWWPNLAKHVENYVRRCDKCLRVKHPNHAPIGELQPIPIPAGRWDRDRLHIDFITKLPVRSALESSQAAMVASANNRNIPSTFQASDEVYLSTRNLAVDYGNTMPVTYLTTEDLDDPTGTKTRKSRKLQHQYFGPFKILAMVGPNAVKLDIPENWQIHDTFNVSRIRLKPPPLPDQAPSRHQQQHLPPPLRVRNGIGEYEIETILKQKCGKGRGRPSYTFFVRYKDQPDSEDE